MWVHRYQWYLEMVIMMLRWNYMERKMTKYRMCLNMEIKFEEFFQSYRRNNLFIETYFRKKCGFSKFYCFLFLIVQPGNARFRRSYFSYFYGINFFVCSSFLLCYNHFVQKQAENQQYLLLVRVFWKFDKFCVVIGRYAKTNPIQMTTRQCHFP